jgi:hypothetical protein
MIEPGRHVAKAIEWKLGVTKGGKEQIGVLFQVADGQTIVWYGYFTDLTTERTLESLEYMGWDGVDITDPKGLDTNEVQLVIEHEPPNDQGKVFAKVQWVNRIGGGLAMKEELVGGALQNFKQRMAGAVMARRQAAGKPVNARKPAAQRSAPPADDFGPSNYGPDDEIPF